jgi:FtsZ-binding cell division protein ZapB
MTIDERLDRLTERHEALTQSVELLVHEQRELQIWAREWQARTQEWQDKNQILLSHVLESVDTLARIAQVHERRITNLEGPRSS